MTITVQLEPELEAQLLAQAAAQGISLGDYVRLVIRQVAQEGDAVRPVVSLDDFDSALDALAESSEALPVPSSEAFRRESIYRED